MELALAFIKTKYNEELKKNSTESENGLKEERKRNSLTKILDQTVKLRNTLFPLLKYITYLIV